MALGVVPAPKPVATVFPVASVVIVVPGVGVKTPVDMFCEKLSNAAFGVVGVSWSITY